MGLTGTPMEKPSTAGTPTLRFILFLFVSVLIVSVTLIGGLVVVAAKSQNQVAISDSVHLARSVLMAMERRLADQLLDYSYWDQGVDNLVTKLNPDWADNNVGAYMHDKFGISSSFVLDDKNRPIYASINGKRVTADPIVVFAGGLDQLIARTRANPQTQPPKPEAGLLIDGDIIHVVAASVLTRYFQEAIPDRAIGTGWVLIFSRALDKKMLRELGANYLLRNLQMAKPKAPLHSAALPLTAVNGTPFGYMTWSVISPAQTTLRWLLPLIGVVFLIFAGTAYLFLKKTQSITTTLYQQIADIETAQRALQASETRYRNFAADVAHELRTPLAALRFQLETFKDGDAVSNLCRDVDQMSRLVSQLLAATQLDWVAINRFDKADLRAVCIDAAAQLAPLAIKENKLIEVVGADKPVVVRGNADALMQAVRNLIENAIRYSARETTVTIDVTKEPSIRVMDRGCGIPKENLAKLFQRFQRSDRRGGGVGLGLSIVKRTAEIHGASLDVENRHGGGVVFSIRFPAEANTAEPDQPSIRAIG